MPGIGHAQPVTAEERERWDSIQTRALHRRIDRDFTYHPPHGDQPDRYALLRELGATLAHSIVSTTPVGREQSLALTHLEEAIFYANAAIARGEAPEVPA